MLDNLRRQIRAEAEATLDKALARARREAVQALRRAVLSMIGVTLALFGLAYASFALFVFLRGEFGTLWAATGLAGLLFALAAICVGFAAIVGRGSHGEAAKDADGDVDGESLDVQAASDTTHAGGPAPDALVADVPPATASGTAAPVAGDAQAEARGTLQAVMGAVSEEIENDTARAILREGTRQVGGLSTPQLGMLAAATGFLYALNAPRRPRRRAR